jgi:hypothetical protein
MGEKLNFVFPSRQVCPPDAVGRADLKEFTALPGLVHTDPLTLDFSSVADIHAHVRAEHWVHDELADGGPDRWLVVDFYDNEG